MQRHPLAILFYVCAALHGCAGTSGNMVNVPRQKAEELNANRAIAEFSAEEIANAAQFETLLDQIAALPPDEQRKVLEELRFAMTIVRGETVPIVRHPWQVALLNGGTSAIDQICGGSLVSPRVVVTAAHCVDDWPVRKNSALVDVLVGTENLFQGGERIHVSEIVIHPGWASVKDPDVAILKLERAAMLGVSIPLERQPISALPKEETWVTGWGAIYEGGPRSAKLRGVQVPVVTDSECRRVFHNQITSQMLCAGDSDEGLDACNGDSGGPLSHRGRLIGIVSSGDGCARRLKYGIYTRVSAIAPWIESQIGS